MAAMPGRRLRLALPGRVRPDSLTPASGGAEVKRQRPDPCAGLVRDLRAGRVRGHRVHRACSVACLRLPDGSVRAWGSDWERIEHLAAGPGLPDLIVASPATPVLTDMPHSGVHFDPQARTVSLWTVHSAAGIHDWPLPGWENWVLDFRGDDHTQQAALLPRGLPLRSAPARARTAQARRRPEHPATRHEHPPCPRHGCTRP